MAKHDGIFPKTPLARPKFEIYTPKGDDKHPHPFHMWSPRTTWERGRWRCLSPAPARFSHFL